MCKFIISLSKIVHQLWWDHPFSQRQDKKKSSGGGVGGDREGEGGQNSKKEGVDNIGGINKVRGLEDVCQLWV